MLLGLSKIEHLLGFTIVYTGLVYMNYVEVVNENIK